MNDGFVLGVRFRVEPLYRPGCTYLRPHLRRIVVRWVVGRPKLAVRHDAVAIAVHPRKNLLASLVEHIQRRTGRGGVTAAVAAAASGRAATDSNRLVHITTLVPM